MPFTRLSWAVSTKPFNSKHSTRAISYLCFIALDHLLNTNEICVYLAYIQWQLVCAMASPPPFSQLNIKWMTLKFWCNKWIWCGKTGPRFDWYYRMSDINRWHGMRPHMLKNNTKSNTWFSPIPTIRWICIIMSGFSTCCKLVSTKTKKKKSTKFHVTCMFAYFYRITTKMTSLNTKGTNLLKQTSKIG